MDLDWLDKNSFLDRNQVRESITALDHWHFNNGFEWFGAAADIFSDLAPQSREYFWKELEHYASERINFKIEAVRNEIENKLSEYPRLDESPKKAAQEIWSQLRRLWGRFAYNPKYDEEFGESLSIDGLYFEIRWILGQILSSIPDITELSEDEWEVDMLPTKYSDLEKPYHIVEFLVKTLSDTHVKFFYIDLYPEVLAAQLEAIMKSETKDR